MANPYLGYKAVLEVNDGASQASTAFAQYVDVEVGEVSTDNIDITSLDESDGVMKSVPNPMNDEGHWTITLYYTSSNYTRARALFKKYWMVPATTKVIFVLKPKDPDGTGSAVADILTVDGYVDQIGSMKFSKEANAVVFTMRIKLNGKPAVTSAANES